MIFVLIAIVCVTVSAFPQTRNESELETSPQDRYKLASRYGLCALPPKPPHGRYEYINPRRGEPGQVFDSLDIDLVCDPGYGVVKESSVINCYYGSWSWRLQEKITECERICKTPADEDIEYRCPVEVMPPKCYKYEYAQADVVEYPCPIPEGAEKGYRPCKAYEPDGIVAQPVSRGGVSNDTLPAMTCFEGQWIKDGTEIGKAYDMIVK